jgi:protein SCO1/2
MPSRRLFLVLPAVGLTALAACSGGSSSPADSIKPARLSGALPGNGDVKAPNVTLTDTNGVRHNLAADARSKVLLLYFGYTHCPDECPTTMADVAQGLRKVPAWVADNVEVAFVTTDPQRDTKPVLRRWLDNFSKSFVGLTGTEAQIQTAERTVGLPLAQKEKAGPGDKVGAYAVNHFSAVLAYNTHGTLVALYPTGIKPSDYAKDLPVIVADKVEAG